MKRLLSALMLIFCALLVLSSCESPSEEKEIPFNSIDILDVGKADCIVINTGSKIVMIDTGEAENVPVVHSYMEKNGYTTIDTLILTHYDKDHIGGASNIISTYNVKEVIESRFSADTEAYISYHNLISDKGIPLKELTQDFSFTYDSCDFKINIPKKHKYDKDNSNNSSLIISMRYKNASFLFCGDAMEHRMTEFMSEDTSHYDFIKLPHHGDYLDCYEQFFSQATPQYCAITCSKKNPASSDTLALLEARGIIAYQTRYGSIHISFEDGQITFNK